LWHDQLETGADNLVFSECPSSFSATCWSDSQAYTLSSPDVMVWIAREYHAYSLFVQQWNDVGKKGGLYSVHPHEEIASATAYINKLSEVIEEYLWYWSDSPTNTKGYFVGYNISSKTQSVHRTYQVAWPVWAGLVQNETIRVAALENLASADLITPFGLASVSYLDLRYNNDNIINPYSNWRGPIWVNVNAIMAYTLRSNGMTNSAISLSNYIVQTLAADLVQTGTWHECYNSKNGSGLAAYGFLSWNTLGADLQANVIQGFDPFVIE
jgi:glycogen debranching enzyme